MVLFYTTFSYEKKKILKRLLMLRGFHRCIDCAEEITRRYQIECQKIQNHQDGLDCFLKTGNKSCSCTVQYAYMYIHVAPHIIYTCMCTCTGFQLFHIRKKYYAMQAATFFNLRRFFDHLECICFDF